MEGPQAPIFSFKTLKKQQDVRDVMLAFKEELNYKENSRLHEAKLKKNRKAMKDFDSWYPVSRQLATSSKKEAG